MKHIYTVQMAKRKIAENNDIKFIDTTVKTGIKALAPTWEMVMGYKKGDIDEKAYTSMYYQRMYQSQLHVPKVWESLLELNTVALGCYCKADHFCHRLLLKDMLISLHDTEGNSVEYKGELK